MQPSGCCKTGLLPLLQDLPLRLRKAEHAFTSHQDQGGRTNGATALSTVQAIGQEEREKSTTTNRSTAPVSRVPSFSFLLSSHTLSLPSRFSPGPLCAPVEGERGRGVALRRQPGALLVRAVADAVLWRPRQRQRKAVVDPGVAVGVLCGGRPEACARREKRGVKESG